VIKALGSVLAGSDRPLIVTSGTAIANTVPGQPARKTMRSSVRTSIPALRRKRRLPLSLRRGSMWRWCDCRRFTTRLHRASLPLQSGCIGKRACARMSERDAIAGRPRTSSTWLASTG
jgi:hypothetical protein